MTPSPNRLPRLDRDQVVRASLRLLDEVGLEGVTLRRLATDLDVQAPALYWHFKDKQDLTDDMAQAILSNAALDNFTEPADINNWPTWIADLMHCLRNALIAHKDGGRVVAGATYGRAYTLEKIMVGVTRVLEKAGFDKLYAGLAAGTTIDYVWGFVIEEQAGIGPPAFAKGLGQFFSRIEPPQDVQSIRTNSEDDAFLNAIMEEYHKLTPAEIFDWGLQVIITGLKSTPKKQ